MNISIRGAKIKQIDPDAFEHLIHLESLDLSRNRNINITSLKISLISIKNLNLKRLAFQDIGWKNSSMKLFSGVHRSISEISIGNNPLVQLSESTFDGVQKLVDLDARNTLLNTCYEGLKEFESLLKLDFSTNNISVCNTSVFPQTIDTLNLGQNHLLSVPDFCSPNGTSNSPNLQSLNLKANKIKAIKRRSFDCLPSITSLVLDDNPLEYIASKAFYYLTGLQSLYLNNVEQHLPMVFEDSYYIPSLIKFNYVGNTCCLNITNCTKLEYVDLSSSDLSYEVFNAKEHFGHLPKLKSLYLISVQWEWIPNRFFKLFPMLEYVNLGSNRISTLNKSLFLEQSRIKTMILRDNQISHIGHETFPPMFWQIIEFFDLSFNPFNCDCSLLWFRDKFKASTKNIYKVLFS